MIADMSYSLRYKQMTTRLFGTTPGPGSTSQFNQPSQRIALIVNTPVTSNADLSADFGFAAHMLSGNA